MNFKLLTAIITVILLSTGVQAAGVKLGYASPNQILQKLPQTKLIFKKISDEFRDRQDGLMALQKEIQSLQEKGQKEAATMAESEAIKLKRKIESKYAKLKLGDQNLKEDLEARKNQELMKLKSRLIKAIRAIGKRDHYDLVVSTNALLFAGENVTDISSEVIKSMTDPKAK